jgi:hypothetical protein
MKNKKRTKQQVRGWLPKATSLPSSQTVNMFNHLKRLELVRLAYGIILGVLLVTPFGVYHSISEPYITGYLWGYDLPIGYVGLLLGILVVLYPRVNPLRSLRFSSLMPIIGLFLLLTFIFSPKYYFINLLHGTSFSSFQIDVDFQLGNLAVVGLSLLSIALGLASFLGHRKQASGQSEHLKP